MWKRIIENYDIRFAQSEHDVLQQVFGLLRYIHITFTSFFTRDKIVIRLFLRSSISNHILYIIIITHYYNHILYTFILL